MSSCWLDICCCSRLDTVFPCVVLFCFVENSLPRFCHTPKKPGVPKCCAARAAAVIPLFLAVQLERISCFGPDVVLAQLWAVRVKIHPSQPRSSPRLPSQSVLVLSPLAQRPAQNTTMDHEISLLEEHVRATPADGEERAEALNALAKAFWRSSLMRSDQRMLQTAVATISQAVEISRNKRLPKLPAYLNNLGLFLTDLGSMSGDTEHAQQAVSVLRDGAACAPATLKPILLSNLGNSLRSLGEFQSDPAALEESISVYREGLKASPSASTRLKMLSGLAASMLDKFRSNPDGNPEDLQSASDLAAEAVEASDDNDPSRAVFLDTYAVVLETLFTHYPSQKILEEAINHYYMAVELASAQQSPKALRLTFNLAEALRVHHKMDSSSTSLDDALSILGPALTELPASPAVLNDSKWCYGLCLLDRFVRDGNEGDVKESVQILTSICDETPENSIRGIRNRSALAETFIQHFEHSSDAHRLDQAVDILKQAASAVDGLEVGIARNTSATVHMNLSVALLARFDLRGSLEDVNSASAAANIALEMLDESSIDYTLALVACANCLLRAYQETEEGSFLDNAIKFYQEAVDTDCVWQSLRAGRLYMLGYALRLRYARRLQLNLSGEEEDWEACLVASRESVELSNDQPGRFLPIGQLGSAYLAKAMSGDKASPECAEHLRYAVSHLEDALKEMPNNHSCTALWLNNLGLAYEELQRHWKDSTWYQQALSAYRQAAELNTASPLQRVTAAYRAMGLLAGRADFDVHTAADFSRLTIQILPSLSPRLLRREDQQEMISIFSGLGSYATSILLEAGGSTAEAVRAFEASRGVMSSMLIDTRTDITFLEERDEQLAMDFHKVSRILDNVNSDRGVELADPSTGAARNRDPEARIAAAKAFEHVVSKIRQLDGLENFLTAPTDQQLQSVAEPSSYIILINVSGLRGDALIVERSGIWNINLPGLVANEAADNANKLTRAIQDESTGSIDRIEANQVVRDVLAWLWHSVVHPILTRLPPPPGSAAQHRVCWIPASVMTNLPIHAATDPITGSNAMDTIISSYATTIRALRHGRDQLCSPRHQPPGTALLLAMRETPSEPDLPFALDEVNSLASLLSPVLPVTVLTHPTLPSSPTPLTKPTFLSHLTSPTAPVSILHLSCHGIASASDPSRSRLLLPDWDSSPSPGATAPPGPGPLTVSDIAAHHLPSARLAYLSACHVASTKTAWLLDEGLHLAAAFQLAGFPQVVGTLWQVSDRRAGRVSEGMWRGVLGPAGAGAGKDGGMTIHYDRVAEAVNVAVRRLREETRGFPGDGGSDEEDENDDDDDLDMEFEDEPFLWAGIVYLGL